jgi:hypothetical protein
MEDQILELKNQFARLEKELEAVRLEVAVLREQRRSRRSIRTLSAVAVVLAVLAVAGVAGIDIGQTQTSSKTTQLQAPFEVVDGNGKPILRVVDGEKKFRGLLAMGSQGTPVGSIGEHSGSNSGAVSVLGEEGQGYAELSIADDIGVVVIGSSPAHPPLGYFGSANAVNKLPGVGEKSVQREGVALRLQEEDGTAVAELSNSPAGEDAGMSLKIRSKEGKVVAGLGVNPDAGGGGALKIADSKGVVLASMVATQKAGSVNVFESAGGTAVADMGAEDDGRGFVRVGSTKQSEAASLSVGTANGGIVQVRNPTGFGVILGISGENPKGDICAVGKKGQVCFSTLCAKNFMPYW